MNIVPCQEQVTGYEGYLAKSTGGKGNPAFRQALFRAKAEWEARHLEPLTYERIGREVGVLVGKGKPVTKQQVSSWFAGTVPGMQLGLALARVLEMDPYSLGLTAEAVVEPPEVRGEQSATRKPLPMKDEREDAHPLDGGRKKKGGEGKGA